VKRGKDILPSFPGHNKVYCVKKITLLWFKRMEMRVPVVESCGLHTYETKSRAQDVLNQVHFSLLSSH